MNIYKFKVDVFVRGEDMQSAFDDMFAEFEYHFANDNNLISAAAVIDDGEFCAAEGDMP